MTFFVCFLAALAGLLFGLDIGVIAGALPFIANEFQISAHTQEWVVSSMMFGAAVGAVGSGWLSFKLGRKKPDDRRHPVRCRLTVLCRRAKR
jgi:SP family galactose:H+ symporter-like MFS transporter